MNNLQRIILVLTAVAFGFVCLTVPKQEYFEISKGSKVLCSQYESLGSQFPKMIEYDYGYLVTRGLLVLVAGGILTIVFRGKRRNYENRIAEK
jgi:hypothetical protein